MNNANDLRKWQLPNDDVLATEAINASLYDKLCNRIGIDATNYLCRYYGGQRIYIGKNCEYLPAKEFNDALTNHFGGDNFQVPRAVKERFIYYYDILNIKNMNELVAMTGVTWHTINRYINGYTTVDMPNFFDKLDNKND